MKSALIKRTPDYLESERQMFARILNTPEPPEPRRIHWPTAFIWGGALVLALAFWGAVGWALVSWGARL